MGNIDNNSVADALLRALRRMLRPLVRVLLRYGISYGAFEDVARRVFLDVAADDFAVPGRKLSASRIAVLTGLSRHDVARYRAQPLAHEREDEHKLNRAARVISGWRRDRAYRSSTGRPAILAFEEGSPSFLSLVKRYAGDIPGRALLDELLRIGAVSRLGDGRLRLEARAYVVGGGDANTMTMLGSHVPELIETIDHNLQCEAEDAFFQRRVFCAGIPAEALPTLRESVRTEGQALLEKLYADLVARAVESTRNAKASGGADRQEARSPEGEEAEEEDSQETFRVVLGMHYLESPDDDG